MLSESGAPTPVAATRLRAPMSLMGPVGDSVLDAAVASSALYPRYAQAVDRESAYERLTAEQQAAEESALRAAREAEEAARREEGAARAPRREESLAGQVMGSGLFTSLARSVGTQLGREISRSLFGTSRRRRR